MLNDTVLRFIRTYVPIVVGVAVAWLTQWGVDIDNDAAVQVVTGVVIALYYALVYALGRINPKFEWLLGSPKTPTYRPPE